MSFSIAHLGPSGTFAEQASRIYAQWYEAQTQIPTTLCAYPTIAQSIKAVSEQQVDIAIAPVENSIEGSVSITLDMLWQLETVQVSHALELPIEHMFVTKATQFSMVQRVYSHPQPLGQCQQWLTQQVPQAQLIATSSTADALKYIDADPTAAAIASEPAAKLYGLPILAQDIQDYADNCTRFWIITHRDRAILTSEQKVLPQNTSLAFSLRQNLPGSLVKALQLFADCAINLSRIESRPSKRSLGDYVFFIDAEATLTDPQMQEALTKLETFTESLKILGTYNLLEYKVKKGEDS
jgi:prephenate dehydratase